ncbi:MAG: lipase family protein [Leptolyngbyaceae cyanobacterium bins.302]|nr:lipase family protein [Leptolyngbyaceae cyanobacterium bins.302]
MTKFNRRNLLVTGLLAGITEITITRFAQAQTTKDAPQASDDIEAIFGADRDPSSNSLTTSPQPSASLTLPIVSYDRAISKLLIRCSHLGMEQFERGQRDSRFNGAIGALNSYDKAFDSYTQTASFTATLDATTTLLPNLGNIGDRIVRRVISPRRVFIGFALTSATHNIIVFRGTSNPKEWIANFQARQSVYRQSGLIRGKVHTGFLRLYNQLSNQVRSAANRFNPSLPCLITGHSLGGALATLATADLAQANRPLQEQLQLYSYAAPRVGDSDFAKSFSALCPNNFRVINFADMVPMVPPSTLRNQQYSHTGQEWAFLDYAGGDVASSHTTTLYQSAIDQNIEVNQIPVFPTACRS